MLLIGFALPAIGSSASIKLRTVKVILLVQVDDQEDVFWMFCRANWRGKLYLVHLL